MSDRTNIVKKGTTILTSKPFAYALNSKCKSERCDNCMNSGKLFRCSGCQYVNYCDRNCQKESWPIHKSECANLKRISPRNVPDAARLMARVIIKLNNGGADEVGYYSDKSFKKFKDLMSHYTDIKKDEKRMEHFISLCGVLFEYLGQETPMPNPAELLGIYGRICINSFNIADLDMNSIGVGIYLGASVIDHSCNPNAIAIFEGTTIIIRTLKDLPALDWSQIRISYVDLLRSTEKRRVGLLKSYYFLCNCERCNFTESAAEAAACPNPSCTSPCSIIDDQCEKCGMQLSENFKDTFREVDDFTVYGLERMKTMAYLDISKKCLEKQRGVLHRLNIRHLRTLEIAHTAAVKLKCWEDAELYGKELMPGYLAYYGEMNPLSGLLYLHTSKMLFYLNKTKEALIFIKKANTILSITHGENHSLIKNSVKPLLALITMKISCE